MEKALDTMRCQPTSAHAQRNGALVLASLLKSSGEVAARALLEDGVEVVLAAMRAHGSNSEVQRWCCEVLAGLADLGGQPGAAAVTAKGGFNDVVSAMQGHPRIADVQRWAATALSCLASSGGHAVVAAFADSGMIQVLSQAMRAHPESPVVQEHGARALSFIALDGESEVVNRVVAEGGIEAVVVAMRSHTDNSEIQRWGLAAMWASVGEAGKAALEKVTSLGGLSVSIQAMEAFKDHPEVQHWGLAFLREVAANSDETTTDAMVSDGGLAAIVSALTNLPDNEEVQEQGLATVAMVANGISGLPLDVRTSSLEAVVSAMRPQDETRLETQRYGVAALAALIEGRRKVESLDRAIVAASVSAMGTHLTDLELQVSAQNVLWAMTHKEGDEVVQLVLEGGSAQAVIAAARAHPGSAELKRACNAWGHVMETVAMEHGLNEATSLARPPQVDETDGSTTTASDRDAEEVDADGQQPVEAVIFDADLEVEL